MSPVVATREKKDDMVRARIPSFRRKNVINVLHQLGTSESQVINMLYAQIDQKRKIPFSISLSSPVTQVGDESTPEGVEKTRQLLQEGRESGACMAGNSAVEILNDLKRKNK